MEDSSSYGSGGGRGGYGGGYGGRSRFGSPRPFRPSPVRVGEEYDVKIDSMSKRGDSGVAKIQGLVVFIVGTKIGDSVKVRITKVGRGYATAEVAGQGAPAEEQGSEPPAQGTDQQE